jgi:hypothetical protein
MDRVLLVGDSGDVRGLCSLQTPVYMTADVVTSLDGAHALLGQHEYTASIVRFDLFLKLPDLSVGYATRQRGCSSLVPGSPHGGPGDARRSGECARVQ